MLSDCVMMATQISGGSVSVNCETLSSLAFHARVGCRITNQEVVRVRVLDMAVKALFVSQSGLDRSQGRGLSSVFGLLGRFRDCVVRFRPD